MKLGLITALLLLCFLTPALAAGTDTDVVYLRDGSVLKGSIKSLTDESIRIVTTAGLDLTIPMDKVERFERKGDSSQQKAPSPEAAEATPMKPMAFEVNVLGLLQFGPYARLHIQLAPDLYLSPHVRIGYAGALGWLLFDNPDIGVGTSLLWFFPGAGNNRLYAGALAEVSLNLENEINVNFGTNFGYRWRFPNGRYWNTGAIAGLSYNTYWESAFFFGMLELSWGFEF
jgi:hypothetical protein